MSDVETPDHPVARIRRDGTQVWLKHGYTWNKKNDKAVQTKREKGRRAKHSDNGGNAGTAPALAGARATHADPSVRLSAANGIAPASASAAPTSVRTVTITYKPRPAVITLS